MNNSKILEQINRLEPYGQKFETPVFAINGTFVDTKEFGKKGEGEKPHLNIFFVDSSNVKRKAVVFNYTREPWIDDLAIGEKYTFAVTLQADSYVPSGVGMLIQNVTPGVNSVSK